MQHDAPEHGRSKPGVVQECAKAQFRIACSNEPEMVKRYQGSDPQAAKIRRTHAPLEPNPREQRQGQAVAHANRDAIETPERNR